ncbi:hypothetical protein EYF80_039919 [Liparis tanakae]|uniref:Uncharacterized protein n=1 Tax=Liparis tanakae TaxID=230148 RepID=A0A4Z2G8L0_9TELE|nr:hypothetical protein EYF80_039919 [Liparis tanakae]
MTPRLRCSSPCEGALTKVEAKDGSSPSTTALPGTTTLPEGPESDSSPKWETTSDTLRAESGRRQEEEEETRGEGGDEKVTIGGDERRREEKIGEDEKVTIGETRGDERRR